LDKSSVFAKVAAQKESDVFTLFGGSFPLAVAPQFEKVIANLELMPLRMNIGKGDKMGQRQSALLQKLSAARLLDRLSKRMS
jgi:hypothetical protein